MKKIALLLTFALGLNAQSMVENIFKNVLVPNVSLSIKNATALEKTLSSKPYDANKARKEFGGLVYSWKKVQATYIAGDLDEDYLDTPRYIDIYHEGNENIHEQLERIRHSKEKLDIELFKNSHKTINALEYMLYVSKTPSKRDLDISKRIVKSIKTKLEDILKVYKHPPKKLLKNEKFINSAILNALVASSFKTESWRLSEGMVLSKKYKNSKDKNRFEYAYSKQSIQALKGILDAYIEVMDAKYEDFGDMAIKNGADEEVSELRGYLKSAKKALEGFKEEDLLSQKGKDLQKIFKNIYISYGLYLVSALEVTAKIVEADGD